MIHFVATASPGFVLEGLWFALGRDVRPTCQSLTGTPKRTRFSGQCCKDKLMIPDLKWCYSFCFSEGSLQAQLSRVLVSMVMKSNLFDNVNVRSHPSWSIVALGNSGRTPVKSIGGPIREGIRISPLLGQTPCTHPLGRRVHPARVLPTTNLGAQNRSPPKRRSARIWQGFEDAIEIMCKATTRHNGSLI